MSFNNTRAYIKLIGSHRWKRMRRKKISDNPLCEICDSMGVVKPASEVHHIVPIESDPARMEELCFDENNLQSLCHDCHVQVHIDMRSKSKEVTKQRNKDKTDNFVNKLLRDDNR